MSGLVKISVPSSWTPSTGGATELTAPGSTVGHVLDTAADAHPDLRRRLYSAPGVLGRWVNVYLNDTDIRSLNGLDTPTAPGDVLMILPALAGG